MKKGQLIAPVIFILSFLIVCICLAYPGDVFQTRGPVNGPSVQPNTDIKVGTYSVSSQTGAAIYSYPIAVPPGRRGMEPSVQLTYSSQNPLRGGLAAGWSLNTHVIKVDLSAGRLDKTTYVSSLAGNQRLIPFDDPTANDRVETFRAEHDDTYTRYEKYPSGWRVLTSDGVTHFFGLDPDDLRGNGDRDQATEYGDDYRYFLSVSRDQFGNEIKYNYEKAFLPENNPVEGGIATVFGETRRPIDIRLGSIHYTSNSKAGLDAFAIIDFNYDDLYLCGSMPVGAAFHYGSGIPVYEGASGLRNIDIYVKEGFIWKKRRQIELDYDQEALSCNNPESSPFRYITSIQERAWNEEGNETMLPAVTFEYDRFNRNLSSSNQFDGKSLGYGRRIPSEKKAGGWPTTERMMVDLDGDGLIDRLKAPADQAENEVPDSYIEWSKNLGEGTFDSWKKVEFPVLPWSDSTGVKQDFNLAYQFSRRQNKNTCGLSTNYTAYRLIDLDGDGDQDLVTSLIYNRGSYDPDTDKQLHESLMYGSIPNQIEQTRPCRSDKEGKESLTCSERPDLAYGTEFIEGPPTGGGGTGGGIGDCVLIDCAGTLNHCCGEGCTAEKICPHGDIPEFDPDLSLLYATLLNDPKISGNLGSLYDPQHGQIGWPGAPVTVGEVGGESSSYEDSIVNRACVMQPEMSEGRYVWRIYWNESNNLNFPGYVDGTNLDSPGDLEAPIEQPDIIKRPVPTPGLPLAHTEPENDVDEVNREAEEMLRIFAETPEIHLSPITLESDRPVSALGAGSSSPASSWHGLHDMDGDGCLDAVWQHALPLLGPSNWDGDFQVFKGNCEGAFLPDRSGKPYFWPTPKSSLNRSRVSLNQMDLEGITSYDVNGGTFSERHRSSRSMVSLTDMNGDGLPDYIESRELGGQMGLRVFYNTGKGFEHLKKDSDGTSIGTIISDDFRSLHEDIEVLLSKEKTGQSGSSWSRARVRFYDVDHDNLGDVILFPPPVNDQLNPWENLEDVRLFLNTGAGFIEANNTSLISQAKYALAGIKISTRIIPNNSPNISRDHEWYTTSESIDLNGDGLFEAVVNQNGLENCAPYLVDSSISPFLPNCTSANTYLTDPNDQDGFRMLKKVDNGKGATIAFNYSTTANSQVVTTGKTNKLSNHFWVVESIEVKPNIEQTALTRYEYKYPVSNRDKKGKHSFRGFKNFISVEPSNNNGLSRIVTEEYKYDVDYSGRRTETVISSSEGEILKVESTEWKEFELLPASIQKLVEAEEKVNLGIFRIGTPRVRTYHPVKKSTYICSNENNSSVETCKNSGSHVSEEYNWELLGYRDRFVAENTPDLSSYSEEEFTLANLELRPSTSCENPYTQGKPRPLPQYPLLHRLKKTTLNGSTTSPEHGYRVNVSTAEVRYEDDKYLVKTIDSKSYTSLPDQVGARVFAQSCTVYDVEGLGLALEEQVVHEPGQIARTRYMYNKEIGIPTQLIRPNQVSEMIEGDSFKRQTFGYDNNAMYKSEIQNELGHIVKSEYDLATGLATKIQGPYQPNGDWPTERTVYDGFGRVLEKYRSVENDINQYVDKLFARYSYFDYEQPTRIRSEQIINYDKAAAVVTDKSYDGLGRLVSEATQTKYGPATTRYEYDLAGNLIVLETPNPKGDNLGHVRYQYSFDSNGRVVQWQPPIGAGIEFTYDGLCTSRVETPKDGSTTKPVTTCKDEFGRLVEVIEKGPEGIVAKTEYRHDAGNNMVFIQNADGIITELEFNLNNQRVAIHRADRTWRFEYDFHGKMLKKINPFPENAQPDDYTTYMEYDDLDRLKILNPAKRDLTPEQILRFGIGPVYYYYDLPEYANSIGRLSQVKMPIPQTDYHFTTNYHYTAEGWLAKESRAFKLKPMEEEFSDIREVSYEYNALGNTIGRRYQAKGTILSTSKIAYNERGLPRSISHLTNEISEIEENLAEIQYNIAGLPISRSSLDQSQTWTYDEQARIISHQVKIQDRLFTGEKLTYDDVGNIRSQTDYGSGIEFNYSYNNQHQLVSAATTDPTQYTGAFDYSAAGRIMGVSISSNLTNSQVVSRDVIYKYSSEVPGSLIADPEAVSQLLNAENNSDIVASYQYDLDGNVIQRDYDGESTLMVYDGQGRLREVTSNNEKEIFYYNHTGQRILSYRAASNGFPAELKHWFGEGKIKYSSDNEVNLDQIDLKLGDSPVARIDLKENEAGFLYHSYLNSLLASIDVTGNIRASFSYGPYGELIVYKGASNEDYSKRYNGKEYDEISSLYYYGSRNYDQLSLNWREPDLKYSIAPEQAYSEPRRMNLYSFNLNNPVNFTDLDGFDPEDPNMRQPFFGPNKPFTGEVYKSSDGTTRVLFLDGVVLAGFGFFSPSFDPTNMVFDRNWGLGIGARIKAGLASYTGDIYQGPMLKVQGKVEVLTAFAEAGITVNRDGYRVSAKAGTYVFQMGGTLEYCGLVVVCLNATVMPGFGWAWGGEVEGHKHGSFKGKATIPFGEYGAGWRLPYFPQIDMTEFPDTYFDMEPDEVLIEEEAHEPPIMKGNK